MQNYIEVPITPSETEDSNAKAKEKQAARAYAAYMILGSLFRSCKCNTPLLEKSLYLYYIEQRQDAQIRLETHVEHQFNTKFDEGYRSQLAQMKADVSLRWENEENIHITFDTGFELLEVTVFRDGSYTITLTEEGKEPITSEWFSPERRKKEAEDSENKDQKEEPEDSIVLLRPSNTNTDVGMKISYAISGDSQD